MNINFPEVCPVCGKKLIYENFCDSVYTQCPENGSAEYYHFFDPDELCEMLNKKLEEVQNESET